LVALPLPSSMTQVAALRPAMTSALSASSRRSARQTPYSGSWVMASKSAEPRGS
jgi:hypothetical protein